MKNEVTAITEEQLGEVSGGIGPSHSNTPPPVSGLPNGNNTIPESQLSCKFGVLSPLVGGANEQKTFVENGVNVPRTKCEKTQFCFLCICKGTQKCIDGWHLQQACNL
ncbi:MAG: hypothetical protein FWG87_10550 [Defluviitaleaceae bacterium]|nr:hypothetical protein [Defluviitaleaceae bacterium]